MTKSPLDFQQSTGSQDHRIDSVGRSSASIARPKSELSETAESPRILPHTLSKPDGFSSIPSSPATGLKRTGTLSWQQRPSRGFTGARGSRPLSMVASENNTSESPHSISDTASTKESSFSMNQIAQSLGSKDPAWFKQTEDRGVGSAAYRRNIEDDTSDVTSSNGPMRLPGLERESSREPEKQSSPPNTTRSLSPSAGPGRSMAGGLHRYSSSASNSSKGGVRSPLPTLGSQRFQPPSSDASSSLGEESSSITRTLAMSPSQGRISPERLERPQSPTKGLGGFVQSAMLKRSDSVNKRWSAQAAPGLSRGNSIASNRSGYDTSRQAIGGISPPKDFRPVSPNRDGSPLSNSRPGSGHSTATVTQSWAENERPNTGTLLVSGQPKSNNSEFVKPALPHLKRSESMTENHEKNQDTADNPVPASPSKKWIPTKASWLENAINKPDSPKPRVFPLQQPNWMMDMNKAKQQRESIDLEKSVASKDVTTGGLLRSPTLGSPNQSKSVDRVPNEFGAWLETTSGNQNSDRDALARSPTTEPKAVPEQNDPMPSTPSKKSKLGKKPSFENKAAYSNLGVSPAPSASSTEGLQARNRLGSPLAAKPKPQASPKTDFRSGLKPRPIADGKESKDEAEFKNVFGKLKRTQTQNYVAPDELKDNILRGKAGLATTGGPQKTERRDELKESILKQKEAMKGSAPPGVPRKPRGISPLGDEDAPTPEAIIKRMGLTKSESVHSNPNEDGGKAAARLGGFAELKPVRVKPKPDIPEKEPSAITSSRKDSSAKGKTGDQFSSSLAGLLSRGPSPTASGAKLSASMNPSSLASDAPKPASGEETVNGPQLTHMTKNRARCPKRRLPVAAKDTTAVQATSTSIEPEIKLPEITSRKPSIPEKPQSSTSKSEMRPLANISNNNRRTSQPLSPRKPSTHVVLPDEKISSQSKSPTKEQLPAPTKTSVISQKPDPSIIQQIRKPSNATTSTLTDRAQISPHDEGLPQKASSIIEQENKQQEPLEIEKPLTSVKGAAAIWGKSPALESTQPPRAKSPVKLPTRKDEDRALERAGLRPIQASKESVGLGIHTIVEDSTRSAPLDRNLPSPILSPKLSNSPKSPPLPGKKPASIDSRVPSGTLLSQPVERGNKSQVPHTGDSSRLLAGLYGEAPSSCPKINTDTQSFLASRSANDGSEKIKTLRKQIDEVTGGGRLLPVPPHREHILFEENLYICTHVFGILAGTRTTEVYLWYGEGVAQSAAEDAQLYARKVAKEKNGKLIVLQQGKETSNFFQALGGIVITRRGSGSHGDSPSRTSATYMLCGRRHVGQIAFDEVDFSARSLCSGFPFIISARFGKLYLWKGNGSGADELGCARLIGMDLGLTGEIEEVDEGRESDAFWESLPGGKLQDELETSKAQHWHLKPSCEKYTTRLFSIDVEPSRPKSSSSSFMWARRGSPSQDENTALNTQIREIAPFTKRDLVKDGTYVLDSFLEIFVYVLLFTSWFIKLPARDSTTYQFFTSRFLLISPPFVTSHSHPSRDSASFSIQFPPSVASQKLTKPPESSSLQDPRALASPHPPPTPRPPSALPCSSYKNTPSSPPPSTTDPSSLPAPSSFCQLCPETNARPQSRRC